MKTQNLELLENLLITLDAEQQKAIKGGEILEEDIID